MEPKKITTNPFAHTFIIMDIKLSKHQYAKASTQNHTKTII